MTVLRLLLLSFALSFGCNYMVMPTDFATVPAGTRANLKANFSEVENKFNPCADSVAQVRARLSGYSTTLAITSLEHLRLKLDGDGTATGLLLVESSNGDSLLRVSESYNSRFFGHLAIDSNLTARKVTAADSLLGPSLTLSGLTASRLMATNAGKTAASVSDLTSWIAGTANQITSTSDGDGTLTLSLPSAVTFPGTVTVDGGELVVGGSVTRMLAVNGPTASNRELVFRTAGTSRWFLQAQSDAEAGSDAGSTFRILARTDAGAAIDAPLTITRAAGGTMTLARPVSVGSGSGAASLVVNGGSGSSRTISWQTNSSARWAWVVDNTSESGSDAGSKIFLRAFTDAGATIDSPIDIVRASGGAMTLSRPVTASAKLTGSDTIAAALGFRAGSAGATDAQLYRSGANMWTTPDSLTVAGRAAVTGNATVGGTLGVTGTVTADSLISTKVHEFGSFTGTLTGVAGSVTGTIYWQRVYKEVTIMVPQIAGTSNSTSCTITGMPSGIRPARELMWTCLIVNNSSVVTGGFQIGTDGVITLAPNSFSSTGFTSSGTKGFYVVNLINASNPVHTSFKYTIQ